MNRKRFEIIVAALIAVSSTGFPALAQDSRTTFSTNAPLTFGMTVEQASDALGVSLNYVRGRPGNELYVALPNVKGSALASRSDGLYLQFRRHGLAAWKGDWGTIRP